MVTSCLSLVTRLPSLLYSGPHDPFITSPELEGLFPHLGLDDHFLPLLLVGRVNLMVTDVVFFAGLGQARSLRPTYGQHAEEEEGQRPGDCP